MNDLKQLFSTIIIYRHNLHVLHWKARGGHFDCLHTLFDNYVDKFNDLVDEVAEMILMLGDIPLTLQECLALAEADTQHDYIIVDPKENYDEAASAQLVKTMFEGIMSIYASIYEKEELPKDIIAMIDGQMGWFRLENSYKNNQRLK